MRKHLTVASATLATYLVVLGLALAPQARPVNAAEDPASRALTYLSSTAGANGGLPPGFSTYDASEWYAIGAAAAGYDPNHLTAASGSVSVVAYLESVAQAATPDAGNTARLLLAALAAGQDPADFGGVNLVQKLEGFYDPATGAYAANSAQGQALSVIALIADSQTVPTAALNLLASSQDSDGGWDYELIKNDPNAATDFDTSDTNSTAFVLMALDAAGRHAQDAPALAWLKTQRNSDGGFPYQLGSPSDPDSTALVIQALIAAGQDPAAAPWGQASLTPFSYLAAAQLPSGAFLGYSGTPDPGTTAMAVSGLERVPLPVRAHGMNLLPAPTPPAPTPIAPPRTPTPEPGTPTAPAAASLEYPSPAPSATPEPSPTSPGPSASRARERAPAGGRVAPAKPPPLLYGAAFLVAFGLVVGGSATWRRLKR